MDYIEQGLTLCFQMRTDVILVFLNYYYLMNSVWCRSCGVYNIELEHLFYKLFHKQQFLSQQQPNEFSRRKMIKLIVYLVFLLCLQTNMG